MAFCASCGTQVPDDVKFCPTCGKAVDGAAAPQAPYPPQQQYAAPPPQQPYAQQYAQQPYADPAQADARFAGTLTLSTECAILYDLSNGQILYEKNAARRCLSSTAF